jgi:hypothetical protein
MSRSAPVFRAASVLRVPAVTAAITKLRRTA